MLRRMRSGLSSSFRRSVCDDPTKELMISMAMDGDRAHIYVPGIGKTLVELSPDQEDCFERLIEPHLRASVRDIIVWVRPIGTPWAGQDRLVLRKHAVQAGLEVGV